MKQPDSKLPYFLQKDGFSKKKHSHTIYTVGDDLEMVCYFPKDLLISGKREQDNLKNAEYALQALNNFPEAIKLLKEICDYNDGNKEYDFSNTEEECRSNEAFDAWMRIRGKINKLLEETK